MSDEKDRSSRCRYRSYCLGFIVVGLVLSYLGHEYSKQLWSWFAFFVSELGAAISIAGVLGIFVEPFFKTDFGRDVFEAAYRYVLPREFKDEVAKVMRQQLLANSQVWTVKVERVDKDTDTVLVTTSYAKTIENKSNSTVEVGGLYTIPELDFEKGSVQILECSITTEDESETVFNTVMTEHHDLKAETKRKLKIRPKKKAKIRAKAIQYRKTTDLVFETFLTPALNPVIEAIVPNDFEHRVQFGTDDDNPKEPYTDRYQLSGVQMPGQFMWVRWWPKDVTRGAA